MDVRKETAVYSLVKDQQQASSSSKSKVKLCGYLKKKRTRVGGWRKMFFVLQDKLLLSYGSKEEYDNKLVSFKYVLNLVPGTMVRPMGGFRFTIETTTQVMYTFHCDDRGAYREWITMLLDSLATQPSVALQKFAHRFSNYSMDNIPNALSLTSTCNLSRGMTNSCDSISHVEREVPSSAGCVRIPIAYSTAKLLERNGVNSMDSQMICNRKANAVSCSRNREEIGGYGGQHFRLHPNSKNSASSDYRSQQQNIFPPQAKQSVVMINRMFDSGKKEIACLNSDNNFSRHYANMERKELPFRNCRVANCDETASNERLRNYKAANSKCEIIYEKSSNTEMTSCTQECKAMGLVKDKIQRMSIKGSREFTLDEAIDAVDQKDRTKLTTTTTSVEQVIRSKDMPNRRDHTGDPVDHTSASAASAQEPIYAQVDFKNKYANRMRNTNLEFKRCNSYDSIIQSTTEHSSARAQRQEKSASLTEEDIEGIYEDGETFFLNGGSCIPPKRADEEENIYEPINVPSSSTQSNAFWKYFTRLKVNSLLHLTRMRKRSSDYDNIKLPAATTSSATTPSSNSSNFSSIKHKFGTHRKSMQVRMRKFCNRAYEPKPFFKHNQSNGNGATGPLTSTSMGGHKSKSKYRWKSVKIRPKNMNSFGDDVKPERRFFGSLPHLRKAQARVSLFATHHLQLDDTSKDVDRRNLTVNTS